MRQLSDLNHDELVDLVHRIQRLLYLDVDDQGHTVWNPDKRWDGADVCDQLAEGLAELGLVPERNLSLVDC
jgi:hypothetical protein